MLPNTIEQRTFIGASNKILIAGPTAGPISELVSALETIFGCRAEIQVITEQEEGLIWFGSGGWRIALVHVDWMLSWSARGVLSRRAPNTKPVGMTIIYADITMPVSVYCNLLAMGAADVLESTSESFVTSAIEAIASVQTPRIGEDNDVPAGAELGALFQNIGIIGEAPSMREIYRQVHAAALYSEVPVLITGESGTGKQLLAEAIHRMDPKRASKPLVTVNCSAITDTLAESELFGHRKGSFTGALEHRRGYFRAAHGGTLFLDEIGELAPHLQPKLLRALEQKVVVPVGEDREEPVDFRVIAATNRDLGQMVANGDFRMDLYQRLNVAVVQLPPLRERPEDIVPLVKFLARKHGRIISTVDSRVAEVLVAYGLPGNVRELENLVRRILFTTQFSGHRLRASDLPAEMLNKVGQASAAIDFSWDYLSRGLFQQLLRSSLTLEELLSMCDEVLVREALRKSAGNRQAAARILRTSERTIFNKIRKHKLPKVANGAASAANKLGAASEVAGTRLAKAQGQG
jgi:transcriptional regulator with GAF, ATPase, and Fis domain